MYVHVYTDIVLNVTCLVCIMLLVYVSRADLLVLGNQLVYPSLGKTIYPSPILIILQLHGVCVCVLQRMCR